MGSSPGQFLRKQSFTSFCSPEQFLPPQAGVGLLHARSRVCVPLSQLVLQSVHCVHVLQPPCPAEEKGGEERGELTFHFATMCQVAYYNNKVSGTPSSPCPPTITVGLSSNNEVSVHLCWTPTHLGSCVCCRAVTPHSFLCMVLPHTALVSSLSS